MEMNFCRRCGAKLTNTEHHIFKCKNDHILFANASPATCLWLVNNKNELLMIVRAIEPGKGLLDAPGGFNDGAETAEQAVIREAEEELGLTPNDYTTPQLLMTDIDTYDYKGEILDVLGIAFWARIKGAPTITPQDDAAEAMFIPIDEIKPEQLYFNSVRKSFLKLREVL